MIRLSNGHVFTFQCASGALGFDGLGYWWEYPLRWLGVINPKQFTVVSKTITLNPIKGNLDYWKPWKCVSSIKDGFVNAVGLSNPGIERWVEYYYPRSQRKGYTIAASVAAYSWEDAFVLGQFLKNLNLAFIELNVSCPNYTQNTSVLKIAHGLHESDPHHPIIIKLSYHQAFNLDLLTAINNDKSIEAIHVINSVPWEQFFEDKVSPIEKHVGVKGGVSGKCIHEMARQAVRSIKNIAPDKPVVAGGGIYSGDEVKNFQHDGADAHSLGTIFLRYPWRPNNIIRGFF